MVGMGSYSFPRSCEFESQCCFLDGSFSHIYFSFSWIGVSKTKIKTKRGRRWSILKHWCQKSYAIALRLKIANTHLMRRIWICRNEEQRDQNLNGRLLSLNLEETGFRSRRTNERTKRECKRSHFDQFSTQTFVSPQNCSI